LVLVRSRLLRNLDENTRLCDQRPLSDDSSRTVEIFVHFCLGDSKKSPYTRIGNQIVHNRSHVWTVLKCAYSTRTKVSSSEANRPISSRHNRGIYVSGVYHARHNIGTGEPLPTLSSLGQLQIEDKVWQSNPGLGKLNTTSVTPRDISSIAQVRVPMARKSQGLCRPRESLDEPKGRGTHVLDQVRHFDDIPGTRALD
jgi:hypothetical protein